MLLYALWAPQVGQATAEVVILQHRGNLVAKGVKVLPDGLQSLPANSGHCIMEMHCGVFSCWIT